MKLVENWKTVLLHSWAIWAAVWALAGPEIIQAVADNVNALPYIDDGWKSIMRNVFISIIPVVRIVQQSRMQSGK